MTTIQVIWHKNPDTDATFSAMIAADFLSKKWYDARAYIQGELNNETKYLMKTYNIQTPEIKTILNPNQEVCLVDHNEASQAPDNLDELKVSWLIDHHKIQFSSDVPLTIRMEPLCSTASILYKLYREHDFDISPEIATMMLACIMSDSLLWKSPTTTPEDQEIVQELQKIANIDTLEAFAMPMFDAKSDLWDMDILDVIQYDYKVFDMWGKKVGIGTLETTNPDYSMGRKDEILTGLWELKKLQNLDFIMLSVVDILGEENITLILEEDAPHLENTFDTKVEDNQANLGKRLSRKKQIVPELTQYFDNL